MTFAAVHTRPAGRQRRPGVTRVLAAYALLQSLSGVSYSKVTRTLEITPRTKGPSGRFFFSADGGWGTVAYERQRSMTVVDIRLQEGELAADKVAIGSGASPRRRTLRAAGRVARAGRTLTLEIG